MPINQADGVITVEKIQQMMADLHERQQALGTKVFRAFQADAALVKKLAVEIKTAINQLPADKINNYGELGNTLLHTAALFNQQEFARLLVERGANPDILSNVTRRFPVELTTNKDLEKFLDEKMVPLPPGEKAASDLAPASGAARTSTQNSLVMGPEAVQRLIHGYKKVAVDYISFANSDDFAKLMKQVPREYRDDKFIKQLLENALDEKYKRSPDEKFAMLKSIVECAPNEGTKSAAVAAIGVAVTNSDNDLYKKLRDEFCLDKKQVDLADLVKLKDSLGTRVPATSVLRSDVDPEVNNRFKQDYAKSREPEARSFFRR